MHKYKIKKENKLKTKTKLFTVCSKVRLYVIRANHLISLITSSTTDPWLV